jgi:inosose dehydratase
MEVSTKWGQTQTADSVLDEMVSAGYSGTELGPWGFFPTDAKDLRAELSRRNMHLIGAFVPIALAKPELHQAGFDSAIGTAQLLGDCGARMVILADAMSERRMAVAGVVEGDDELGHKQWVCAMKLLENVASEVNKLGLRAVFHHHAGTYVETPREVSRLMADTDPSLLGLCLDTGHYLYGGGDPVKAAEEYADRIWHLHLKDVRKEILAFVRRSKVGFLDAVSQGVFCPLGEGIADIPGVIRTLQSRGYNGWAVFEQDVDPTTPGVIPRDSASSSRAYLRNAAGL